MAPPKKTPAKPMASKTVAKAGAPTKGAAKPAKAAAAKAAAKETVAVAAAAAAIAAPPPQPPPPPPPSAVVTLPPAPIDINDKEAIEAYQDLYEQLGELRWKLTNIDDIERIKEVRDEVYDVLTALHKAQIADNTAAYAALQPAIDDNNKKLDDIRKDIDTIVKNIAIAGTVASAISRVLAIAIKL